MHRKTGCRFSNAVTIPEHRHCMPSSSPTRRRRCSCAFNFWKRSQNCWSRCTRASGITKRGTTKITSSKPRSMVRACCTSSPQIVERRSCSASSSFQRRSWTIHSSKTCGPRRRKALSSPRHRCGTMAAPPWRTSAASACAMQSSKSSVSQSWTSCRSITRTRRA